MKIARALLVVFVGLFALVSVLRLLQPVVAAPLINAARPLEVVINEVAWGGTAAAHSSHEWIELKNNTTGTLDLTGWRLRGSGGSTPPNITLSGTIPVSGYFLLERGTDLVVSDILADQIYSSTATLLNSGGSLTLTDPFANVIDTANGNGGAWPGGSGSPAYDSMERIDPLALDTDSNWADNDGVTRNGLDASGNPINGTPKQQNSAYVPYTEPPRPTAPGSVLISAVHFAAYHNGDEGFRLTNVSTQVVTLTNWIAHDNNQSLPLTGTLDPGRSIWLAKRAITFTQQFGFKPDYEYEIDSDPAVPNLPVVSAIPALSGDDALALREGASNWIDGVAWGVGEITDTGWITGWIGSNVQLYTGTGNTAGQILYRKLDEATGRLLTDTHTAVDWANDRTDPISGRKEMFPGWDLEKFWQTAKVTGTATLTVAIAPDNAFRVISDFLGSARQSIKMEMYSFENFALAGVVTQAIQSRHISVTILLEGGPPGGITDDERWICQQIEAVGGQCWFMISDSAHDIYDRYDYVHAKLIVVDDHVVAIGSENLSPRSLTYDDPADGTFGQRGTYLLTDAPGVVARALEVFNADFDPLKHRDLYRWVSGDPKYGNPLTPGYQPLTLTLGSGYFIRYPAPLTLTAPLTFELLTSPESSLHAGDGLLGLIDQAGPGDSIDGEQLDEPPHWGPSSSTAAVDPNIRLQALIDAASRGAHVRLLLDSYFDVPTMTTSNAATQVYINSLRALSPTLMSNLEVRRGNPSLGGIHNKMFLFHLNGRKVIHAGSLNGTEGSNKVNREVALQVDSSAAYDYLRAMFEYDWAFQARAYLPVVMANYVAPPNHVLISKVFYLGSVSPITGSEWVQLYNPTAITVSLNGFKIGDQALPGPTGYTVDGMWWLPAQASLAPGQQLNIATTAQGFFDKYGFLPQYVFFGSFGGVVNLTPYITYTPNISFSLANSGDEVLVLGPADQLIDGVAWGTGVLPGNVVCLAIDPNLYPLNNPSIARSPLWRDTDNCPADFVIDTSTRP